VQEVWDGKRSNKEMASEREIRDEWDVEGLRKFFEGRTFWPVVNISPELKVVDGKKMVEAFLLTAKVNRGKKTYWPYYEQVIILNQKYAEIDNQRKSQ
jgi:hypothetical protein